MISFRIHCAVYTEYLFSFLSIFAIRCYASRAHLLYQTKNLAFELSPFVYVRRDLCEMWAHSFENVYGHTLQHIFTFVKFVDYF